MVAWASSKMLVYFNGCVCCTKNSRYHILGTILSLGTGKGSMMDSLMQSREKRNPTSKGNHSPVSPL
jgi:hypothetical protein